MLSKYQNILVAEKQKGLCTDALVQGNKKGIPLFVCKHMRILYICTELLSTKFFPQAKQNVTKYSGY